jgi:hypothetical protein
MRMLHRIECVGKDRIERTFVFDDPRVLPTPSGSLEYRFAVTTDSNAREYFELILEGDDGDLRIDSITHNRHQQYRAKGIPDALLPYVSSLLELRIRSSRSNPEPVGKARIRQRCPDATKMWERLVKKGIAEYLEDEDFFRTTAIQPIAENSTDSS